jgi:hypothetical protein
MPIHKFFFNWNCYGSALQDMFDVLCVIFIYGARGNLVAKALCYKPEGHGFGTRRGDFLNLPNPSGHTRLWGLLSL